MVSLSYRQPLTWLGGHWWLWRSVAQHGYVPHWTRHILLSQTDETVVLFPSRKMDVIKRWGFRRCRSIKQQKADQKSVVYASAVKPRALAKQTDLSR